MHLQPAHRKSDRLLGLAAAEPVGAQPAPTTQTGSTNPTCPDSKLLSRRLITDICWSCLFPIRLLGASIGGGFNGVPPDASTKSGCMCRDGAGLPHFGITLGLWSPAVLVEVVRKPYCSPTLGGATLVNSVRLWGGHRSVEQDAGDKAFYHFHWFAFPLTAMLDLLAQPNCSAGGYSKLDLLYLSEVDPTWNEDELAFLVAPETAVFANPLAIGACVADCAATTVSGSPPGTDSMFWCAGCWGHLYPLTGNLVHEKSPPRDTSLLATRAIAQLHRKGLAWRTVGDAALCGGYIAPMIPKSQYRLSQVYPLAEASGRCCHPIGRSTFEWGEWRNIPAVGEDFIHLVWRYTDCCLN